MIFSNATSYVNCIRFVGFVCSSDNDVLFVQNKIMGLKHCHELWVGRSRSLLTSVMRLNHRTVCGCAVISVALFDDLMADTYWLTCPLPPLGFI